MKARIFVSEVLRKAAMFALVLALQAIPLTAWGEIGLVRIHLGQGQNVSESYELGENDFLELHNRYSLSVRDIEVVNWLSGKKLVSIQEIEKGQSAKMQFSKGTYIVRYLIADGKNGFLNRQFQVEVKAKVVL